MEMHAAAVSANLSHDSVPVFFGMFVAHVAHVSHGSPRTNSRKSQIQTFLGHPHQFFLLLRDVPNAEHPGSVPKISVIDSGTVHIDDIAAF